MCYQIESGVHKMALTLVEQYEYEENGITYIYEKYKRSDGSFTEDRHVKSDNQSSNHGNSCTMRDLQLQISQANRVQRGRTEINGEAITIAIDQVDPMAAAVTLDVQGTDAAYSYSISEEALTVMFTEKVQAYINWEVRG